MKPLNKSEKKKGSLFKRIGMLYGVPVFIYKDKPIFVYETKPKKIKKKK